MGSCEAGCSWGSVNTEWEPGRKIKVPKTFLQQSVCVQWDQIAAV